MTSSSHTHDIWTILDKLQMDARTLNSRIVELRAHVAALQLPEPARHVCDVCGLDLRGPAKLAEHRYVSHDGPLPDHWARAEALAADLTSNTTDHDQAAPA